MAAEKLVFHCPQVPNLRVSGKNGEHVFKFDNGVLILADETAQEEFLAILAAPRARRLKQMVVKQDKEAAAQLVKAHQVAQASKAPKAVRGMFQSVDNIGSAANALGQPANVDNLGDASKLVAAALAQKDE